MNSFGEVRILSIELRNIKNVKNGTISLNSVGKDTFGSSIIGVYGQNGSGKTALIWAMELVKRAMSGEIIPKDTYHYICQTEDKGSVSIEFSVTLEGREYTVTYTIVISKAEEKTVYISNEKLDYKAEKDSEHKTIPKNTILEINSIQNNEDMNELLYRPATRVSEMKKKDKNIYQKLLVSQALAKEKSCSFILNNKTLDLLDMALCDRTPFHIAMTLFRYCRMNLFVLNRNSESSFNMLFLPLSVHLQTGENITKSGNISVRLGENAFSLARYEMLRKVLEQINTLIGSIIPGLKIEIMEISRQLGKDAEEKAVFELISNRNGVLTPLRYESEGIKKILYMLSSLIAMYNESSIFVAIDEMDAGIFEYLLGEILETIYKTGKGQLLFTSHNMRPLEVLENSNIYFTTTNPENKYIQFSGIKTNHNLRATLLRTIDLGGQKEEVYEATSQYRIGKAFRKARSDSRE